MKKILALILAIMMTLVSVSVAFAADDPAYDAKVTVTDLDEGDVAHFYKIVEWVGEAEGNVKGWKVVSPFNIADFDLEAVLLGTPEVKDPDTGAVTTAAVPPTGITAELANKLASVTTKVEVGNDTVGSDGIAELDVTGEGKGPGIYMVLIKPTKADVVYNPVFVSSDYKAGGSDTWSISEAASYSDVAAAKKSTTTLTKTAHTVEEKPDDEKWITTAIGDTVDFTVTTKIPGFGPAFIAPFFKMTDKLTDLTLKEDTVTIKKPTGLRKWVEGAAEDAWDYKLETSATQYSIEFNPVYLKTLAEKTELEVTYDAIVATTAPKNVNREKNEVWTEFSHDINDETDHSFKKVDTIHYTFTLDADALAEGTESEGKRGSEIVKVGVKADGTPITETTETSSITSSETWKGPQQYAHFKLYRNEGCTVEYIPKAAGTGVEGEPLDIISGADGRMTIAGLDAGEYWLKEVSCPAGFVMDTHVAHIVISTVETEKNVTEWTKDGVTWLSAEQYAAYTGSDKDEFKSCTYKMKTLDSYSVTIDGQDVASYTFVNTNPEPEIKWTETPPVEHPHHFTNKQGTELPSTGGVGTTMLYTFGSIMLLAAAVLLVTKRRVTDR